MTIYWTGFLANDRLKDEFLNELAKGHLRDSQNGKCTLIQRKLSTCVYEYIRLERKEFLNSKFKTEPHMVATKTDDELELT